MPGETKIFLNEGEYWTISYGSNSFRLKDTKGLQYIATLLRNPGREFHVLELVAAAAGGAPALGRSKAVSAALESDRLQIGDLGNAGDMLDAQAKASYRRRLRELQEEAEEAGSFNDSVRAERAAAEIDALEQQLSAAFGLGGRPRKAASAAERARVNVRNTIAAAMKVIATHGPELGEHLRKTLRTGTFCWYVGDGEQWQTTGTDPADGRASALPRNEADEPLLATFLLSDIVASSSRKSLDQHDAALRQQLARYRGEEVAAPGDGFLVLFDSPANAIKCALALQAELQALGLLTRVGVHTGECIRRADGCSGVGIQIAARIMSEADGGEILVSSTVRELVSGSGIEFADHGFHSLRGVPGSWRLFTVGLTGVAPPKPAARRRSRNRLSLMVVDDHPMWRQTLRTVLEGSGVGTVVAEASDGEEVVEVALAARPEVVIMDMNLLSVNGVEATHRLLEAMPDTKVLMLSSSDERHDVVEAVKAGASGYLVKTAGPDEVADAVQRIRDGELVFPPALAKVVLEEFRRMGGQNRRPAKAKRS